MLFRVALDELLIDDARHDAKRCLLEVGRGSREFRPPIFAYGAQDVAAGDRPVFVLPVDQRLEGRLIAIKLGKSVDELPDAFVIAAKVMWPVSVQSNAAWMNVIMDVSGQVWAAVNHHHTSAGVM